MRTSSRGRVIGTLALVAIVALATVLGGLRERPAAAQQTASIVVRSLRPDGSSPLLFVRFEITGPDGASFGARDTAPPDASTTFAVPPGGPYTVAMILPPPCRDASPPQVVETIAAGDSVALTFITDVDPTCDVNPVAVWAYACTVPPTEDAPYEVFITDCDTAVDRLDVTLGPPGDPDAFRWQTGANGIPGRAGFAPVPSGDYVLGVERPDGIRLPDGIAQCLVFDPGLPPGGQWLREFRVTGDELYGLTLSLAGVRVSCDYFFFTDLYIPDDRAMPTATPQPTPLPVDTGTLTIHVSSCPPRYDGGAWYDDCHDAGVAGARVELRRAGAAFATGTTAQPAVPGPGVVAFPGLEAKGIRIRLLDLGDADLHVYCSAESDGRDIEVEMEGTDAIIDLPADENTVCDLSIIPIDEATPTPTPEWLASPTATVSTEPAALTVRTGLCPADYSGPDWAEDCTLGSIPGLPFTLYRGDQAVAMGATGDTGLIGFKNLPPGDYRLVQEYREGLTVSLYAVRCIDPSGDKLALEYIEPVSVAFTVPAGEQIDCSWWVVGVADAGIVGAPPTATPARGATVDATSTPTPAIAAGRGAIIVALYRCEGRADDDYDWYRECDAETRVVDIVLTAPDGTTTTVASADGRASFPGLADGAYDVTLASGAWCHAEADRVDNAGNVIVLDGGATGVYIYRCIPSATATPPRPSQPYSHGGPVPFRNALLPE